MTKSKPSPTILPAPVDTPESHSRRRFLIKAGVTGWGFSSPAGLVLPFMKKSLLAGACSVITKRGSRVRKLPLRIYGNDAYLTYFRRPLPLDAPWCVIPGSSRVGSPAQRNHSARGRDAVALRHSA